MLFARLVGCVGALLLVASVAAAPPVSAHERAAASRSILPSDATALGAVIEETVELVQPEDDASAVDPDAASAATDASATPRGAGTATPPGMANGTFPGQVWAVADVGEVRAAVNAFRAAQGLPGLGTPFSSCTDRGVVITPGFGLPAGTTHGQVIVAQNPGFLRTTPSAGGVMTAEITTGDQSDFTGVVHPRAIALVRLYECATSSPPPGDPGNVYNTGQPSPQPSPSAPAPEPSPSAPAPTPSSPAPAPEPSPSADPSTPPTP